MERILALQQTAQELEEYFLEEIANRNILNYSININYDDREIDGYYFLNRPIEWITCTVSLKKEL